MRSSGDIGEAEMVASEPGAPVAEPADIVQMLRQIGPAGAELAGIWRAAAFDALQHLLAIERLCDLAVEFIIEPGDQAAGFSARQRFCAEQRRRCGDLVDKFDDRVGVRDGPAFLQHENGRGACWVQREKGSVPLPGPDLHQIDRQPFLPERHAHLAAEGRKRQVVQRRHRRSGKRASGRLRLYSANASQ